MSLSIPSISLGSGDACEDTDRLEYYRTINDTCSEDLMFLEPHNDSLNVLTTLLDIFPYQEKKAKSPSKSYKALNTLLNEISYTKPVDLNKLSSWINADSTTAFIDSIRNLKPLEVRNELIESRINLHLDKEKEYERIKTLSQDTPEWRYQKGALAFYNNILKEAKDILCNITGSENPWINESALYTCARIKMRLAQEYWDGYQPIANIDLLSLSESEESLKKYLDQYPSGIYRNDVIGLLRRVAFLGNRYDDYLNLLSEAILERDDSDSTVDTLGELDRYVVRRFQNSFEDTDTAKLVTHFLESKLPSIFKASIIFFHLRSPTNEALPLIANWIEENDSELSKYEGLKSLLLSALLYSKNDFLNILDLSHSSPNLEISLGILEIKAKALDELKRYNEAIQTRLKMVEIIGYNSDNTKDRIKFGILRSAILSKDFELLTRLTDKPYEIKNWAVDNTVQYFLPITTQEKLCENESTYKTYSDKACLSLVRRYLYVLDFANTFKFHKLVKNKASLGNVSKELWRLKSLNNPHTSLKLATAEFIIRDLTDLYVDGPFKLNYTALKFFDSIEENVAFKPTPSTPPIEIFIDAMNESKARNNKEDEARAIVGILRCYKPSNSAMNCGDYTKLQNKSSKDKRKELFQRLKSDLKATKAAKEINIYW
jgi:hypothetical protein